MDDRRALWILIGVSTTLRLVLSASLGVGNDEAYYALLALHPAWSYFDHPPMLAVVTKMGMVLFGGAFTPFAIRFGFVMLFAGSTFLIYRVALRSFGPRAGFIAAFLLNDSAYYGTIVGTWLLPDGPLLFFWLLTLDRLLAALDSDCGIGVWIGVGLAWGGAMLCKYHGVFLPVGAGVYLVLEPKARRILREPGCYVAFAIGLALFSPVIFWNAAHGWSSFAFQASRAVGAARFRAAMLLGAMAGQAGYMFPWIWCFAWASLIRVAWRWWKTGVEESLAARVLLCQALVPLVAFLFVACWRPVLPHWGLIGLVAALPLVGRDWASRWAGPSRRLRLRMALLAAVPIVAAGLIVVHARTGCFQKGGKGTLGLLSTTADPTVDLFGWDIVGRELAKRGYLGPSGPLIFTSKWYDSGHLAFIIPNRSKVLCYDPRGAHAFADWSDPRDAVGKDGLLVVVGVGEWEPEMFDRWFASIQPAGEFDVVRAGVSVRHVRLYRCINQLAPFPEKNIVTTARRLDSPSAGSLR